MLKMKSKNLKTTSERSKPKSANVGKSIKAAQDKKATVRKPNTSKKKQPEKVIIQTPAKSIWIKIAEWLWGKPW